MKQGRIVIAFNLLMKLYKIEGASFGTSSVLFNTKRRLQPYVEHQAEQESLLAEKYSDGQNADGTLKMEQDQQAQFFADLKKIQETEVDFEYKPVRLVLDDHEFKLLGLNGEKMEALEGFMDIEVDGKKTSDFAGSDEE